MWLGKYSNVIQMTHFSNDIDFKFKHMQRRLVSLIDIQIAPPYVNVWLANQVQIDDGVEYRRSDNAASRQCVHNGLIQRYVLCVPDCDDMRGDGNWGQIK